MSIINNNYFTSQLVTITATSQNNQCPFMPTPKGKIVPKVQH